METIHSYQAVTSDNTYILLMERMMALQQMICKKNTVDFVQFLRGANFIKSVFEDCPVWGKICKIATNHPHLLSVGDDREIV